MSRFPRAGWERQGSTSNPRCKPSGNMVQESYEPPEEDVICSAYAKCRKPCHHAKPHKPAIVARKGFRGNDIDTHVDYPDGIICTTKGNCDMGLFIKCHEIPAEVAKKMMEGKCPYPLPGDNGTVKDCISKGHCGCDEQECKEVSK